MDSVCIIFFLDRIDGILDPKRKNSIGVSVVSCPLLVARWNGFYSYQTAIRQDRQDFQDGWVWVFGNFRMKLPKLNPLARKIRQRPTGGTLLTSRLMAGQVRSYHQNQGCSPPEAGCVCTVSSGNRESKHHVNPVNPVQLKNLWSNPIPFISVKHSFNRQRITDAPFERHINSIGVYSTFAFIFRRCPQRRCLCRLDAQLRPASGSRMKLPLALCHPVHRPADPDTAHPVCRSWLAG
jgi:hypothetical protein